MVQPYVSAAERWLKDTGERALRAFLAAFTSTLVLAVPFTDLSTLRAVLVAAGTAGVSAVLSLFARPFGDSGSASFLK